MVAVVSRDVFFYAGSTDVDVIRDYYLGDREDPLPASQRIVEFTQKLAGRLEEAGCAENAFEPAAGLDPPDLYGDGLYVGFEGSGVDSIRAQMIAFELAEEMGVGTYDTMEESDGRDSTREQYDALGRG